MNLLPATLPPAKQTWLAHLVASLRTIPGVVAVVLGGSYARGTQRADSDLDVGIYYRAAQPFDLDKLRTVARTISVQGEPVVTDFYGWGAWVNGGAWIQTATGKVDFLYRNLDQVEATITEAEQGILRHDYGQQPAHGFYSVIYLAETAVCRPLFDPDNLLTQLKARVQHYPPALKARTVTEQLWNAEFTLIQARDFAAAGDVYTTVGCLTRAAANLTQVLFALNEVYFMGDKKAMTILATFAQQPQAFVERLQAILGAAGTTDEALGQSVAQVVALWTETVALTNGAYQPKFVLPRR